MIYKLNTEISLLLYPVKDIKKWKNVAVVYVLVDPRDNLIKYVGKSVSGVDRAFEHVKPSSLKNDKKTKKANWLFSLLNNNLKPIVFVVDYFNLNIDKNIKNQVIYNKEQTLIQLLKKYNTPLTNLTDGGPGAVNRSINEETRLKMSISAKKRGLPAKLVENQKLKYGPPVPKYIYYKKKPRKDPNNNYLNSLKKAIYGENLTTNNRIVFNSMIECERYFKNDPKTIKFNRAKLRDCIKNNKPYYGFYWSFVCQQL